MRSSGTAKLAQKVSNTHKHLVNCVKAIRASFILISFILIFFNMFPNVVIVYYFLQPYANSSTVFSKGAFLPNFASELTNSTGRRLSNFHSPCSIVIAIPLNT